MMSSRAIPVLTAVLLFSLPLAAQAEPVGRVIMTVGPVTATDRDDRERAISRHDPVYEGESVRTGSPRGRAQIRLRDEGLIQLRPGTEFDIEQYREPEDDQGGSAVMNLVEGALRKISGRIGTRDEDEYEMNTPTATVGIRGTDYSLQYCGEDCIGDNRQLGVYGRVDDGTVTVENEFGVQEFGSGDHFFVPDGGSPSLLLMPPDGVLDDAEDTGAADEDGEENGIEIAVTPVVDGEPLDAEGDAEFEAGDVVADDLLADDDGVQEALPAALLAGGFAGQVSFDMIPDTDAGATDRDANVAFDANDRPVEIVLNGRTFDFSSAGVGPEGATQGVDWGVWVAEGFDFSFTVDETIVGDGAFVWAHTDQVTTPEQFAELSGTRFMSLDIAGPTTAFDTSGNPVGIDFFDLGVDLDNLEAEILNFQLSEGVVQTTFDSGTLVLDADTVTLVGSGIEGEVFNLDAMDTEGPAFADFDGFLIGESADGTVIGFEIDRSATGRDDLGGTVILGEDVAFP